MNKLGRKSKVFLNTKTFRVVAGNTLNEALGVSYVFTPSDDWKQVNELPKDKRIVLDSKGFMLPNNNFTSELRNVVDGVGDYSIKLFRREVKIKVIYTDKTKIIVEV